MTRSRRTALLDRAFDAIDEREALALFRARGFVGAQPARWSVGSWRDDAEESIPALVAPDKSAWVRINPSIAMSPDYFDAVNATTDLGNDSWD